MFPPCPPRGVEACALSKIDTHYTSIAFITYIMYKKKTTDNNKYKIKKSTYKRQTKKANRVRQTEIKTYDRSNAAGAAGTYNTDYASNNPENLVLNPIAQGNGFNNRIGNKIVMKSLHVRANIKKTSAGPGEARVIVVYDRQANGLQPTFNAVFANELATNLCYPDPSFFSRFEIIIDKRMTLVQGADNNGISFDEFRILNHEVMYNGTGGVVYNNIITGSLTLFFCSNDTLNGGLTPYEVQWTTRIRYYDY